MSNGTNGSRIPVAYIVGGLLITAAGLWMGSVQADVRAAAKAATEAALSVERLRGELAADRSGRDQQWIALERWQVSVEARLR